MQTLFSTIPKLAWLLSDNRPVRFLTNLVKLWFFVLTRKFLTGPKDLKFNFVYQGVPMPLVLQHPMDLAVLREIYINKEYEWCPIQDPKIIVDLGAHFGDTALYYHCRFPEATIIAVEPAPESFARLLVNTKDVSQIRCVQAAISAEDGELNLHIMPSSLGNSLMSRDREVNTTKVKAMRLDTLINEFSLSNIDLLKFDIEGAEFLVFRKPSVNLKTRALIGEVHEDLGGDTIKNFVGYFSDRSVEVEPLFNQKRFIVKIL